MKEDKPDPSEIIQTVRSLCHEINQPLTIIMARSELLLMGMDSEHELYRPLEQIKGNTKRLADLIKDVRMVLKGGSEDQD